MNTMSETRFVTRAEKATAEQELRQAHADGLISADDLARRVQAVERAEDLNQLTAAAGGMVGHRLPAVERPSTLTLALPHLLGAFTAWLGPLIVWLFSSDKVLKRESAKALTFQVIGSIVVMVLGIVDADAFRVVANMTFTVLGLVAAVYVGRGHEWHYLPARLRWFRGPTRRDDDGRE